MSTRQDVLCLIVIGALILIAGAVYNNSVKGDGVAIGISEVTLQVVPGQNQSATDTREGTLSDSTMMSCAFILIMAVLLIITTNKSRRRR